MRNEDTSVLPVPTDPDDQEPEEGADDQDAKPRWWRRIGRRAWVLNGVILAALVAVLGLIVYTVRGTGAETVTTAQTVAVGTGDVTATVSANGNVAAGTSVNVDFQGSGGVVTAILVEAGDKVRKGQLLARVDPTSAEQALEQARVQLASAQASYETTVQGQTPAEQQRDQRSIDQAQVSVDSARSSVRSAQQSLNLTRSQQNAAVGRARTARNTARAALRAARDACDATKCRRDTTSAEYQALEAAKTELTSARNSLEIANESRASALLQARQQVTSAQEQVDSAEASLASSKASAAVNQQGARSGAIAQAQSQIDSALIGVAEAQETLDQTELRAPVAGRIVQVNGTVGQASSSASGSSSGSSSGTSTSSASSSTDTSGFVVLTGADILQVTADVAEADIADVKVGQPATITLSASGRELTGSVTAVAAVETVTNNVVEYGVTVTLDETKKVKLGQSTQVVITTGEKQGVVRVSSGALTTIGERTTATLQGSDGATSTVDVVTGLEGDGFTQILDGLEDGDEVVVPEQSGSGGEFTFPGGGGGAPGWLGGGPR